MPGREEAELLLGGLSNLIRLRGVETFVAAPILLPEPRFFPEKVEPRAPGVATLLRRLLAYAGLEPSRLDLEIYDDDRADEHITHPGEHRSAVAWFMGIADGVYRFGVREDGLRDEHGLIGTLGHEVAHAYRNHHRLVVQNRAVEEQLTDLTTVYLGFGAFTLESSFRFKTGHYGKSGQKLLYERQGRGYLRPGQLAFLLGAQMVARGLREKPLPEVLRALSDNQALALRQATAALGANTEELLHTLGLPPVNVWPSAQGLEDLLEPLPPTQVRMHDRPKANRERHAKEKIGFRVAGTRATYGTGFGLAAGITCALLFDLQGTFWPSVLGLGAAGLFLGNRIASPTCSGCSRKVRPEAARCTFCGLSLVGDIQEPVERFDAEDAYRAKQREEAASKAPISAP